MRFLQAWVGWVRQWNRRRATIRTLRALSDWQLEDIGLTRDQITTVVDAALGPNPSAGRCTANRPRLRPQAVLDSAAGRPVTT